jgi:hypothetical protein
MSPFGSFLRKLHVGQSVSEGDAQLTERATDWADAAAFATRT